MQVQSYRYMNIYKSQLVVQQYLSPIVWRVSYLDNSLPGCTPYTSSIQDLHSPQDFTSKDSPMHTIKV